MNYQPPNLTGVQAMLQDQRRRRRRASRKAVLNSAPPSHTPSRQPMAAEDHVPASACANSQLRTITAWFGGFTALLWLIVIATHVEWVRRHDGPITPISFSVAIVLSLLAAGLLLVLYRLKGSWPHASALNRSSVNLPRPESASAGGAGNREWPDVAELDWAGVPTEVAAARCSEGSNAGPEHS
jgi:hypothetical protein